MKPLAEFSSTHPIRALFTDIDDTLTDEGKLGARAFAALWDLQTAGVAVVPVTGRPAGWCEMIARIWPVAGVVGENGGFYYRLSGRQMKRRYMTDSASERAENRRKLDRVRDEALREIPGCAVASDQFCRELDLAIDFAEDVGPLSDAEVDRIVAVFERNGAQAKVSSIHVNGWFGDYDKLGMCRAFAREELGLNLDSPADRRACAFSGDSPNDEPMFDFFENSFGVSNVLRFASRLKRPPKFIASQEGGEGFVAIAHALIASRGLAS